MLIAILAPVVHEAAVPVIKKQKEPGVRPPKRCSSSAMSTFKLFSVCAPQVPAHSPDILNCMRTMRYVKMTPDVTTRPWFETEKAEKMTVALELRQVDPNC